MKIKKAQLVELGFLLVSFHEENDDRRVTLNNLSDEMYSIEQTAKGMDGLC
ncbi:hypothetical protein [Vibrio sp. VB16]|uniref:hypothetical protein n=1 Tax=Vibrio sp. VB16 TaxID=2785746 RepID=UPI00189F65F6|nr:hypothetical protein [Vibrio sp. VB16]UGA54379.1 hypothetical protein IUZ65_014170 [Vibrio sp. VB16]